MGTLKPLIVAFTATHAELTDSFTELMSWARIADALVS
jgi:hypothetical protein